MFFKKKVEKRKIFYIVWADRYKEEFEQVVLSTTKQRAVIALCETYSVGKIISIEEITYE